MPTTTSKRYAGAVSENPASDFFSALDQIPHADLIEFVEQLQAALDDATAAEDALRARVTKLEGDREILRARLEDARSNLQRLKAHPLGRITGRLLRSPDSTPQLAESPKTAIPLNPDSPIIATILDPISDACWSPEFQNVRLDRQTWRDQLDECTPDLLFVESAFRGSGGSWTRRVNHFGRPHADLADLVVEGKHRGIPTVFWNKEDPVNYGWFIGAASLFDHVFTVDGNTLDRYRADLGHDRVTVLPFAAQPTLHHPGEPSDRTGTVAFAGSYYVRKHAERRTQMEMLLRPALPHGLEIYDRMAGVNDPRFRWPDEFVSRVVGSVPYAEIGDVYRRYRAFLNVNTVTDSPTMCARRIYELAACGTPIVSGPSAAIGATVPRDVAVEATRSTEASHAIGRLLSADAPTTAGPEWIASGNTYQDRLTTIFERL